MRAAEKSPAVRFRCHILLIFAAILLLAQNVRGNSENESDLESPVNSGRQVLFGVAIGICCLVLFFFVVSVLLAIVLFVCCVKFFKESNKTDKSGEKGKRPESEASSSEEKLHPLSGACSVESLTNGNFKCNPHYSKVEYKSDVERSTELAETPSSVTDLTLYTIGYQKQYDVMTPPTTSANHHTGQPAERSGMKAGQVEDYDDIYQQPPSNEKDLYSQLARRHFANVKQGNIELSHAIGKGEFGTVWEGEWSGQNPEGGDSRRRVAVKTLNPNMEEKDRIRFLQEAVIIGQFRHPNIVKLLGVVKESETKMIILELTRKGDLRDLLCSLNRDANEMSSKDLPILLLKFSRQISDGMDYLAKKCFIHRDLAARNVLVTEDYMCKIADFGMARDLAAESCYMSSGGLIPVRWTAPEALSYGMFSAASDAWSYGALLYEIWSLGRRPFDMKGNDTVIDLVQTGYRLPPPPGCPQAVYSVMISCWNPLPHSRPQFSDIRVLLWKPEEEVIALEENVSSASRVLGGPLEDGDHLYQDLQSTYVVDLQD